MIDPIAAPNANRNTGHSHSTPQRTDEQIAHLLVLPNMPMCGCRAGRCGPRAVGRRRCDLVLYPGSGG